MSLSYTKKAVTVTNFIGAHVVAPIAVGSGGTILVRYLAKAERIISLPWMGGMSALALAGNAGAQYLARNREAKAIAKATPAEIEADKAASA